MYKPLELFIGLRYIRAKRRNQFISFISTISMVGIALGVTALITVLSVMNGFVSELRERILSMTSHVTVTGYQTDISDWRSVSDIITRTQKEVIGIAPFVKGEGMLSAGREVHGVLIRGILPDEEPKVADIGNKMILGELSDLKAGNYNILLGTGLARSLDVMVGDKVTLITPQTISTPAGIIPRFKRFTVVGIFEIGHNDYDTSLAVIHITDAAKLFRLGDKVSGIRLKLQDLFKAGEVRLSLSENLPGAYWITDWTRQHANFFRAVQIEKRMMFIILLLIVAVAAFNIVATLVMVVRDKQSDIAILRTLGLSSGSIMSIFIVQGTVVGAFGTFLGFVGGVSLALNVDTVIQTLEKWLGMKFMPADVYYISEFPSQLLWNDVIQITTIAFILTVIATIYPAWNAARTRPAEALRYE
ncbi:MAG: lipoprotein-releasing ABC transporter permease subunit [Thiohalomonadales bacterium]